MPVKETRAFSPETVVVTVSGTPNAIEALDVYRNLLERDGNPHPCWRRADPMRTAYSRHGQRNSIE